MIYVIIVFGLRKGSRIHRKGFWMFPKMFGYENTLFWTRGKAHGALGRCKRQFCGGQRARHQGPWRLALGLRKTPFCAFQKPCGLSPLAQIKCSHTKHFRKHPELLSANSGTLPETKHYYPIYQSLPPNHYGAPRHVQDRKSVV